MRVLLVYLKGFCLSLGEAFAVDLGLAPECRIGYGGKGGGEASADRGVEGVRVKVGNGFASFPPLLVEVCASPDDVVEVAVEDAAIVAYRIYVVVQLR